MKSLKVQVLFHLITLIVLTEALGDGDSVSSLTEPSNDTDTSFKETYSSLAARLNCSELVVSHKGFKVEEILSDSIYKPTPPPSSTFPFEDRDTTLTTVVTEEYGDVTESTRGYDYQDHTVHFNFVDDSVISDYVDFYPLTTNNQENRTGITGNVNIWLPNSSSPDSKTESLSFRKIDYSSGSKNKTAPPDCLFAFDDSGDRYNWFQVISESGGVPGEVNATRLVPNVTEVLEPCHRPVTNTSPPSQDLLYEYELIVFKEFYRREKAFLRFAGTPSEFVDIIGQLVWAPPHQELRFYRLSYRKDDTGFYVNVHKRHKCVFEKEPLKVNCNLVQDFSRCSTRSLSPALKASLIG